MSTRDARELCDLADVTVPPEKHTPGPWKIEPRHIEGLFVSGADNIHSVVAQIRVYPDAPDESASNARLIAMAPALLESHAQLLRAATGIVSVEIEMNLYDPNLAKYMDATAKVREAIAAAEKLAVRP
jgi:hypothetical protein